MKRMYDGDALNFTMLIEKNLTRLFRTFSPFFNIPHPGSPFAISKYLTFLGPGHATMANYLKGKDSGEDVILNRMRKV